MACRAAESLEDCFEVFHRCAVHLKPTWACRHSGKYVRVLLRYTPLYKRDFLFSVTWLAIACYQRWNFGCHGYALQSTGCSAMLNSPHISRKNPTIDVNVVIVHYRTIEVLKVTLCYSLDHHSIDPYCHRYNRFFKSM